MLVVFIHGLYVDATCWDEWRSHFEAAGYETLAPEWPGHGGDPAALRAAPPAALESLTFEEVVDAHRQLLADLDEPPVLVGHSMGGLITQILLSEGLARAGVAIDSAPPKGVTVFSRSFLKSNKPSLGKGGPIVLTPDEFHYAFTNHLDAADSLAIYEDSLVPEARAVAQGPLTDAARIDFDAARPPLLMIAGEDDHIIPAKLNAKNARKYGADAPTTLTAYPGRTHWTIAQDGWQQVADDVLGWIGAL